MAIRGRKCKPIAVKKFEGNPGKRPLGDDKLDKIGVEQLLTIPKELSPEAKKVWRRYVPLLINLGFVTNLERDKLIDYCTDRGIVEQANQAIIKNGFIVESPSGYRQVAPEFTVMQQAKKQADRTWADLGLSPAERSRMAANFEANKDGDDEMEKILNE